MKEKTPQELGYINEFHKITTEKSLAFQEKVRSMEIDWEKEVERQRYNSQDHPVKPKDKILKKQ